MDKQTHTAMTQIYTAMTDEQLKSRCRAALNNMRAYIGNLNAPSLAKSEFGIITVIDQIAMRNRPQIAEFTDRMSRAAYRLVA